jgi:hypothetical protein
MLRRVAWRKEPAGAGKRPLAVTIAVAIAATSGCGGGRGDEGRATDFARDYLRTAANGNVHELCALRTDAALRRWGGQAACERRAKGLAIDPLPPRVGPRLRRALNRKALAVNPRSANVVPDDTSITNDRARVVIDFGKAILDDGRAVGGEILEMDLRSQDDDYMVTRLGFAAFAD